jgi:hypothetical protein
VALAELERLQAKGEEDLVKTLKEQSNKSPAALRKALSAEISPRVQERLRAACNNDGELYQRVLPFAGLIRLDTLEYPMVIPDGQRLCHPRFKSSGNGDALHAAQFNRADRAIYPGTVGL